MKAILLAMLLTTSPPAGACQLGVIDLHPLLTQRATNFNITVQGASILGVTGLDSEWTYYVHNSTSDPYVQGHIIVGAAAGNIHIKIATSCVPKFISGTIDMTDETSHAVTQDDYTLESLPNG